MMGAKNLCYNEIMKKVVVKCQLPSREDFEVQTEKVGLKFQPSVWQHERIYWPRDYQPMMNYPRLVLRTEVHDTAQPANYTLYLKRHIEDSGVDWVFETAVGDYTATTAIVHQLGFNKVAEVSRQRQTLQLDEKTHLYMDVVEGLAGTFLKIEIELGEDESVELLRAEMFKTLKLFGLETFLLQTYADLFNSTMQPYLVP